MIVRPDPDRLGGAEAATPDPRIDAEDVAKYDRLGEEWWDTRGSMAQLHKLNPARIGYLRDLILRHFPDRADAAMPLTGLTVLDIGCGGGLLSEPLARLGATMTGIDPALNSIATASRHAEAMDLDIDYRTATAEDLAASGERFDVVVGMEVVEHVPRPEAFVGIAAALVRPGGLLVLSTLNRTAKSFALAIVGAEYILRWLPRGTHRWTQFITPDELAASVRRSGLKVLDRTGLVYNVLRDQWTTGRDIDVNYLLAAARPAETAPKLQP